MISLQAMDFQRDIYLVDVFTLFMERKFTKEGQVFSKYNQFESGFNKSGNIF